MKPYITVVAGTLAFFLLLQWGPVKRWLNTPLKKQPRGPFIQLPSGRVVRRP